MKKILLMLLCTNVPGCSKNSVESKKPVDVLLTGGGIVSAALGTYSNGLEPGWVIGMVERLDKVAEEGSSGWDNTGTGRSTFYELNYTSKTADGSMNINKAVAISESFEISKQFWAYQVDRKVLNDPKSLINDAPHMNFVWGGDNVAFLKKRHAVLQHSSLFRGMEYSEDPKQIKQRMSLMMEGHEPGQKIAAIHVSIGTDVNSGEITHQLVGSLSAKNTFKLRLQHGIRNLKRNDDDTQTVTMADLANGGKETGVKTRFIFIGAGSDALKLLQMFGIPEVEGYAGFPVGDSFLTTANPGVVKRHLARVYGRASVGSPPMSMPYLDTRMIDGKPVLLLGPFATFSTKFLKNGLLWDLLGSMTSSNIGPMFNADIDNFDPNQYLVDQLVFSRDNRMASLREYFPEACDRSWKLVQADQRMQIIKKNTGKSGVLQFGTGVVIAADGSVVAPLGAPPGASTAAPIMLSMLKKTFKNKVATPEWQARLEEAMPSYGRKPDNDIELTDNTHAWSNERLQLIYVSVQPEA